MMPAQGRLLGIVGAVLLLWVGGAGGCSSDTTPEREVGVDADGGASDVTAPDAHAFDGGPDIDIVPSDALNGDGDASPDAADAVVVPLRFDLFVPRVAPVGSSIPLRVHALNADGSVAQAISGGVNLETDPADALAANRVILRRGVGSLTTGWTGQPFRVRVDGAEEWTSIAPFAGEPTLVDADLVADTVWPAGAWVRVERSVTVAQQAELRLEAGVWVELAAGVNLLADGPIIVTGDGDSPVVFSGVGGEPWGGVAMGDAGGEFTHAMFIEGGADSSRAFGHSDSQPVVFSDGGDVVMNDCTIQDGPGKAVGSLRGEWVMRRSLMTRTDTGGEFEYASLLVEDSWFMDFPELDPAPRDDDNDAIYLLGDPNDPDPPRSTIRRSTFIRGADDGIDHNGSTVVVEQSWIEGFDNECIAASSGAGIHVEDTVLTGCHQCLEAGYGAPTVTGNHLLAAGCDIGLRFGDNYERDYTGTLSVRNSVVFANAEHDVWNWLFSTNAPAEGRVRVDNSLLSTEEAEGGSGNVVGDPELTDLLLLAPDSVGAGIGDEARSPGLLTERPGTLQLR